MDAVVIGGGLIGLSIAWRLRQTGMEVSVWDAGRFGAEASWAGAGMLAPGGELDERSWWSELAIESLRLYPEFVRELQEASGQWIDYRHCGAFETAGTEQGWPELLNRADRQRQLGIRVEQAGPRRLFYPDDAAVNPRHVVDALRTACERTGVVLHECQPVQQLSVASDRIMEPEPASLAVLAAGAWSSSIQVRVDGSPVAIEPAVPVRGHLISFAPSPEPPGPIVRQGHTYILERSDGLAIAGSTTEQVGFQREPEHALFADIELRARQIMPRLQTARRLAEWIGFRPGTASGEPQLGRLKDTPIYLAYGHYRNGILMAPRTASLIADAVNANLRTDWFLQGVRH